MQLSDLLMEVREEVQRDHEKKLEQLREEHRRELNNIRDKQLEEVSRIYLLACCVEKDVYRKPSVILASLHSDN